MGIIPVKGISPYFNFNQIVMKKLHVFLGLAFTICFLIVAMISPDANEKLEGKWNVTVADAPYGYQDYMIDIKKSENNYKADILFVYSKAKITGQELSLKDGKLTGNVYVENEKVDITIWEEKGVVKGTAESPSIGKAVMTFSRPKEKE